MLGHLHSLGIRRFLADLTISARTSLTSSALVLATVLFVGACSKPEPAAKLELPRPVLIHIAKSTDGLTQPSLSLPAETRARIETRYGFRVGGKVSQRLVAVGDKVAAGQLIAKLDPQDLAPAISAQQAQINATKTEISLAQADLTRAKDLRDKNFVSQSQVDRQQAVLDGAKARLGANEAQLKQALNGAEFQFLRAEKPGVVLAVEAEVGQVVAAGQAVIRVAQDGPRDIVVNVPETSLKQAASSSAWSVQIPSTGNQAFSATLREISPIADPASRTYTLKLSLNGQYAVPLGATAVVQPLVLPVTQGAQAATVTPAVFMVPINALYSKDGKPNVWLVDSSGASAGNKEGVVRLVPVATGGLTDDSVRITSGIKNGDKVVIAGANLLIAGQKVKLP
jgi:membrane fusion protein, multidrug efflux system